jgi:hypothetical protein
MSGDPAVPDLEIATTLSEVATRIQRDSYAIYRIDDDTHQAVQEAWQQARAFFSSIHGHGDDNEQVERRKTIMDSYQVIQEGHLLGFHVPSAAKYLFRAYCDDTHIDKGQPWPSESFRIASCRLARKLDEILNQCCSEIRAQITETHETDNTTTTTTTTKAETKRKRAGRQSDASNHDNIVSRPEHCPLDYFLYHGCVDPAIASNCTAHVDRGFLIAICLTNNSPGLEVLPASGTTSDDANYVCPEVYTQRASLYTEAASCTNLLCILAGDQWRQLDPDTTIKACTHRVRNNLRASRLSISYELRI